MSVSNERGASDRATNRRRSSAGSKSGSSGAGPRGTSARASRSASSGGATSSRAGSKSGASTRRASTRGGATRATSSGARAAAGRGRSGARSGAETAQSADRGDQQSRSPSRNGKPRGAVSNVIVPLATATIGVAGGVLLGRGRNGKPQHRKVFGVELPTTIDMTGVGEHIGEAGRQFAKLAGEIRSAREKAEQIGRALR